MTRHFSMVIALLIAGCTTTVNLTARNVETFPQDVLVTVKDDMGQKTGEIFLGIVQPDKEVMKTFDVKHGGQFTVISRVPRSADIFETTQTVTKSDKDPLNVTIDLKKQGEFLDDATAMQAVSNAFSKLGPNVGAYPVNVSNALRTIWGALIVVTPGQGAKEGIIHQKLNPGQFSKPVTLERFSYPHSEDKQTIKISAKAAASLAASFPLWGSLGFNTSSDSVYEIDWRMEGFGMVEKEEDPNWNYLTAYQKLPPDIKKALTFTMEKNPGSVMMYVNRIYVIEIADLSIKSGARQDFGTKLEAGGVITGTGAYTFSNVQAKNQRYKSVVLNFGGPQFLPVVKISDPISKTPEKSHIYPTWHLYSALEHGKSIKMEEKDKAQSIKALNWLTIKQESEQKGEANLSYEIMFIQPTGIPLHLTTSMVKGLLEGE